MTDAFDPAPPEPRAMCGVCRCSSPHEHAGRATDSAYASSASERASLERQVAVLQAQLAARNSTSPDAERFQVVDAEEVGPHLVMRVRYPNVSACPFDGTKVMVFANRTAIQALRWKTLDPHFREKDSPHADVAPSPVVRFPASDLGWRRAIKFAKELT